MNIQTAALIALLAPLSASATDLKTADQTQAVCAQAAKLFAAGQYDQAYESLAPHWPLPEEEILNLGYQTKTQLGMVAARFGPSLGEEHVEIARMNLDYALERPELAAELMPGMKLVAGRGR